MKLLKIIISYFATAWLMASAALFYIWFCNFFMKSPIWIIPASFFTIPFYSLGKHLFINKLHWIEE